METKTNIMKATKYIHYKVETAITAQLSKTDLTAAQSHVLMCIMDGGDIYSSDIHRRLHISRSTVSGLIKKLRANGYITYENGSECCDERHKRICVTDKAREHKAEIDRCMKNIESTAFEGFTKEELDTLNGLLTKMAENTKQITKGGL